jgi:hypothetical protein
VWVLIPANNRRLDDIRADLKDLRSDMNARFGEVNRRLDQIGETLPLLQQPFFQMTLPLMVTFVALRKN